MNITCGIYLFLIKCVHKTGSPSKPLCHRSVGQVLGKWRLYRLAGARRFPQAALSKYLESHSTADVGHNLQDATTVISKERSSPSGSSAASVCNFSVDPQAFVASFHVRNMVTWYQQHLALCSQMQRGPPNPHTAARRFLSWLCRLRRSADIYHFL
jgi:hypothetical protein